MKVLTDAEADAFVRDGYVVVRGAFAGHTAEQLLPEVWARIEEEPHAPAGWKRRNVQVEELLTAGPVDDLFTQRYCDSVDDLVGEDRWTTSDGFGWVILRFPGFAAPPWRPPDSGWHVDGIDFQHRVFSPEQALVGIELLTDVEPGGGGTAVRVGSHAVVARTLRDAEPGGLSYRELRAVAESIRDLPVVEFTGRAGDVLWMHPHTAHARSPNTGQSVRIAANRCIRLRPDAGRAGSLVEWATEAALTGLS